MMRAAQERELRELRQLGYLISVALSEPGKIDTMFRVGDSEPKTPGSFEEWGWGS